MNETPATVRMIDGAAAPAISNVFVNNACAVCTLQITGTFAAATVLVEGIVNVASNQWVTLAAFNLSDLSLEKDGADKAGIYQVGIEGILRVRMNVTEVSGGDITIAAQFGNATINQFSKTEASNLIPITAYDLAVAGGYTGTLEQFEADMGNSASNATAAANSANDAASSASDASASATASEAAATNMAPVYSASSTYAVGDYVLYNGGLFQCTTAITTAEAWTAAHWTTVKMGPEVSNLKTQLTKIESEYSGKFTTEGAAQIVCAFPCSISSGDTVKIKTTYTGSNATTIDIRFYDSNDTIHVIKTNQAIGTDYEFISEGDYVKASFYKALSAAELGKVFNANITVSGEILNDISELSNNLNALSETVDEIDGELSILDGITLGNLMPDLSEWILGRVYNGVYSDAITTTKCTDYIPVIGGKTYYLYGGYISQEYFGVYDDNKNVVSGWSFSSVTTDNNNASVAVITLAQTARFIRINALVSKIDVFPTDAYIGLYPNNLPKTADMSDYVPRLKGNGTLSDKKILVVGDSISTDVYGGYKKWVTFLCEQGFFSSGFVTNNSYHATGYVATYKESGVVKQDTFLNRVTAVGDLSGYDMIITFGGINDWIQSIDFDEFKDAVDDYYAYLTENATQARIAILSPLRTSLYGTTNTAGKTQKDYDDYIKSVALEYAFPILDLTDTSGFCPEKSTTFKDRWTMIPTGYESHDGVHPIAEWEKKYLAPQIAWFLSNLM